MPGRRTVLVTIPDPFWQLPEVAAALRKRDLGKLLVLVHAHTGASQTQIGIACGNSRGTKPDVSITASQGPVLASRPTSSACVLSPRTARTPTTSAPDSSRLKVVTSQPRSTAPTATARPANLVPPSTSRRIPPSWHKLSPRRGRAVHRQQSQQCHQRSPVPDLPRGNDPGTDPSGTHSARATLPTPTASPTRSGSRPTNPACTLSTVSGNGRNAISSSTRRARYPVVSSSSTKRRLGGILSFIHWATRKLPAPLIRHEPMAPH